MYKIIFLYGLFSLFVWGQSSATTTQQQISTLITQVKVAKSDQRRLLMNRLKVVLRKSNQAQRIIVMKKLKQSFANKTMLHQGKQGKEHKCIQAHNCKAQCKYQGQKNKGRGRRKGKGHGKQGKDKGKGKHP